MTRDEPYEISVASDRASVAMRRYIKQRSDEEHSRQDPRPAAAGGGGTGS